MNAQELRINNWVKCKSESSYKIRSEKDLEFQWSTKDWYAVGDGAPSLEEIEGIPLTEEWLTRFGFTPPEFDDNYGGYLSERINDHSLRIKNNEWNSGFVKVKLDYVHSLQNLFFAITGTELTLKTQ